MAHEFDEPLTETSAAPPSLLSTPGPYPLPAYLRALGTIIATQAAKEGLGGTAAAAAAAADGKAASAGGAVRVSATPLLASFIARCLTLEAEELAATRQQPSAFPIESAIGPGAGAGGGVGMIGGNGQPVQQTIHLTKDQESALIAGSLHRLQQLDDPLVETLKMQVAFESLYATEVQKKRTRNYVLDQENAAQLAKILAIGTNIQSNAQVASLYRAIFRLMLQNGCVDLQVPDRNVDREIAAALESVFPQAGLNSFNMMSPGEKKLQVLNLINIVLGIRLFNRDIKKGGAGLQDLPTLASAEVENLYDEFERESTTLGEICYTYSDVLAVEFAHPGTISASVARLQVELLNRRQYILLLHQLQHEVLESLDLIQESRHQFQELTSELKTLVGLRTSVPKEQVYPKFQSLAVLWRGLEHEREANAMRRAIFEKVLVRFRQSFTSNLLEEDIELLKKRKQQQQQQSGGRDASSHNSGDTSGGGQGPVVDFDEFVETLQLHPGHPSGNGGGAGDEEEKTISSLSASYRPVRLVKEYTPTFMSLPLEYQGYCPWSIVHRGGLLLPGNPALGIIRVLGRHYSFTSPAAMQDFCEDPEKYIEGVLQQAKRQPALIHLLCLQPYIPHSDISELFSMQSMLEESQLASSAGSSSSATKSNAGCQTPQHINTTLPDPNYHWNEWDLRRSAIQMADLTKKKTVSAQTNLSHFRRDNATQYTLAAQRDDGTMDGQATQTGVEKSSQVERVYRYHAGLRGRPATDQHPGATMRVVELRIPTHVEDATNASLQLQPHESLKTKVTRERK